jgi:hypothetical protein
MPLWCLVAVRQLSVGLGVRHRQPTEEDLCRALAEVADAIGLDPFGAARVQPVAIRVKGSPVQYSVTGTLTAEPDVARVRVLEALRSMRFRIRRRGPVAEFLGWQTTAVRGRITLTAAVGAAADDDDTPFRRLRGASYVQITVA